VGGVGATGAGPRRAGVTAWYEQLREQYRPYRREVLLFG
jgi:hypothetical protein